MKEPPRTTAGARARGGIQLTITEEQAIKGKAPSIEPGETRQRELKNGEGKRFDTASQELARAALKCPHAKQAGFFAELATENNKLITKQPVLYGHGEAHRELRRAGARFFTPAAIDGLTPDIERIARSLAAKLKAPQGVLIDELALELAGGVALELAGLDIRRKGIVKRLMLAATQSGDSDPDLWDEGTTGKGGEVLAMAKIMPLWLVDVMPALRKARRHISQGGEARNLIEQLAERGYNGMEVLMEVLTYASAGIVTTREFIGMCAWWMLGEQQLRTEFVTRDLAGREELLLEMLMQRPVVGHLYRRIDRSQGEVDVGTCPMHGGDVVAINIRQANQDAAKQAGGPAPEEVHPGRPMPKGIGKAGLSFGDGPHRCPGGPLAIREAAIMLGLIMSEPKLEALSTPTFQRDETIKGYEVRDLRLRA